MRRQDLHIAEPCHEDWEAMQAEGQRRFCEACTKHVHDLSSMTEAQARAFLDTHRPKSGVCVRYMSWSDTDEVIFADDAPEPRPPAPVVRSAPLSNSPLGRQWSGVQRLLAASAMVLPLLGAGHLAQAQDTPPPAAESCDAARAYDDDTGFDVFRIAQVLHASRALAHDTIQTATDAQRASKARRKRKRRPVKGKLNLRKRDAIVGLF